MIFTSKKSYVQSCLTVQDKSCMQFLNFFFVRRTYIGWFNAYLFYLQLHHACFCLTLSSSAKCCRWFVFQIYCPFYVCVSVVLSCFMIIPFVQESIRNPSNEMLLSVPDSLLASLPAYDTQLRERCSITFSHHFSLLIYGFNFW